MSSVRKRIIGVVIAALMLIVCPIAVFATEGGQAGDVAVNSATEVTYGNVSDALNEAAEGETIVLQDDAETTIASVTENVTLDLNGHALKASYVTCFGNIVDKSEENAGILNVDANRFLIQDSNAQLPVKGADGYQFVDVTKFNKVFQQDTSRYIFQPLIEKSGHALIKEGKDMSGITVSVRVSWEADNGKRSQNFVYSDELVSKFLDSYGEDGKYGKMFTLTLTGTEGIEKLTFEAVVVSDTGVEFISEPTVVQNKNDDDNTGSGEGGEGEGPLDPGTPDDPNEPGDDDIEGKPENPGDNTGGEGNEGGEGDDPTVEFPEDEDGKISGDVSVDESNFVTEDVELTKAGQSISAIVPAGVKVEEGTTKLVLTIKAKNDSDSDVETEEDEVLKPFDVHIEGIAADNTKPIIINMGEIMPVGMNIGNYTFYHVEGDVTKEMTAVSSVDELNAHNQFYYDPATGHVTVCMTTFSEVAVVADTVAAWEGVIANDFSGGTGTEDDPYIIANADQLAYMNKQISAKNGTDAHYKLIADINFDGSTWYPIGYWKQGEGANGAGETEWYTYGGSFNGTFDGNGHTVSNIYQNTWELNGNYDNGYWDDAMGLFGYVNGGTVKNITIDNFQSDGEFTPTGCVTAYAVNSTFENIALTNCNPRVYNTGNGGIVGIGGNSNDPDTYKLTFTNITIDNTNKISALWGSWDVACGGLVGMFRGAGHVYMTNCHVAAQIDVFNDVCGNYQYYWYRYAGMMIGTNKNMTNDANGYTVPETDKFHAENCTVHFGEWNDYYYCELVANSLASYTHDHQFSRLTQVDSVDVDKMTVTVGEKTTDIPTSGRVNYVVVNGEAATENATCYHFVDGEVWNHVDAGEETVDVDGDGVKETVLKENNAHIYLPFNQLFTGYGWGVKHVPIYDDGTPNPFAGVTILDREVADSVEKFVKADTAQESYTTESIVTIGELFVATDAGLAEKTAIKSDKVQVTVSPVGEGSTADATYTANTTDWKQGTLTFSGTGTATITITDYYFCTPTTINVTINDKEPVVKFEKKFTGDFLYRVGNQNAVKLDSLFKAKDGVDIGTVSVTVETLNDTAASGTYTPNATWTNGTIQFNKTGVVKVTITDNDYCTPTELLLEVVDATNITTDTLTSGATDKNVVILGDVKFSGGYLYYKNSTIYGNGFTIDITEADHSDLKDSSDTNSNRSAYCNVWLVDSTLNNVRISGSVYPEVGMTADSDYGNAAIRTEGNCFILNSYVSNCRVPLRVQGNTTLEDTVVDGGRYANIELRSGKLVLDGVTTINTVRKGSDGTTDVIGFGIVIHSEAANASIKVKGDGIKQYNWAGENKHKTVLSGDTYLSNAYKLIFNTNNSDNIYFDYNNDRYVNTGILCLCADINKDVVTGLDDRYCQEVSGHDAWVLTYDNAKHTEWFNESVATETIDYAPAQAPVIPTYSGNEAQTVEFPKGETYDFDTSVLTAEKFGQNLEISSVVMNGTTYNYGDKIAITEGGTYEIIYTVVDPYNYNADATEMDPVNHTVSISLTAIAKDAEILAPKFTFIDQNGNKYESTTAKVGDKTYVMPNVTAADPTTNSMSSINIGSTSISGTTVYFPVATGYTVRSGSNFNRYYPLFNGINITDYTIAGDTTGTTYTTSGNYTSLAGSSGTKFIIPANGGQTNCGDYVKTDGQAGNAAGNSDSGWQGAGYSTSYGGTYLKSGNTNASRGADSNGYERIVWVEYTFNAGNGDVYYYRIGYHCNKESAQSCVTPDTLVTLADGSQKEIQDVTYDDKLIVWDFYKGEYTTAPSSIIMNHGEGDYEVVTLNFEDGTTVNTINGHGFYDKDDNKFVILNKNNVADYVGHNFIKQNGDENTSVKLVSYEITNEHTESWSILTAGHYNCILEGMLTLTPAEVEGSPDYLMPYEINSDMKYDEGAMQKDIEKYGLYTYEDFKEYMTYEQFEALGLANFKVSVGKRYITWDEIMYLIDLHIK